MSGKYDDIVRGILQQFQQCLKVQITLIKCWPNIAQFLQCILELLYSSILPANLIKRA